MPSSHSSGSCTTPSPQRSERILRRPGVESQAAHGTTGGDEEYELCDKTRSANGTKRRRHARQASSDYPFCLIDECGPFERGYDLPVEHFPDIEPELTEPELSNRVVAAVIRQLDRELGPAKVDTLLGASGLPRSYLRDPDGWVSMQFVHRLTSAVAKNVHGLDAPPPHDHPMWQTWRRAGRSSLDPSVVGPIYVVLRAFGSPERVYAAMPAISERGTRMNRFEVRSSLPGGIVLAAVPVDPSHRIESTSCWFQRGLFEAIPTLWRKPEAHVEHHECMCDPYDPAETCVYRIHFESRSSAPILATVALGLAGGVGAAGAAALVAPERASTIVLGGIAGAAITTAIDGWHHYARGRGYLRREAADLERLLAKADQRFKDLWHEGTALRRSVLAARKLSGYLAKDLVEQILEHPELELQLGGRETTAAVLFADVVGFTPRCEHLSAAEVVEELNIYFRHVDRAFEAHRGVIDKRMGDGIMAVFVPLEGPSHPVGARAVRCAVDILRRLVDCNEELVRRGSAPFELRLGVAAGPLVQGNMGSEVRLEYTVIGDVVNLASRLEGQATPGHVLVPHALLEELAPEDLRGVARGRRRTIQVKGRGEPVDVQDLRPRRGSNPTGSSL